MATKTQLFSYDDLEHREVKEFLDSRKKGEMSKYIRIAIKEYMYNHGMLSEGNHYMPPNDINNRSEMPGEKATTQQLNHQETSVEKDDSDDKIDITPSIFELGK